MIKEASHRSNVSTGSIQYTYYAFTFILTSSVCSFFIAIENALQTIDDLILMCSFNKRNLYIPCSCCNILTWYWNPDLVIQQLLAATYHTYNASASIGRLIVFVCCICIFWQHDEAITQPLGGNIWRIISCAWSASPLLQSRPWWVWYCRIFVALQWSMVFIENFNQG